MMRRRLLAALVSVALLGAAACGTGTDTTGGAAAPAGAPRSGGSLVALQVAEPRSLDPALLGNAHPTNGALGNALYGTLLTNDPQTGAIVFGMAESLTTTDNGTDWTLTLRAGLRFSDGAPLDAAAVKLNWERLADPALGSPSLPTADYIVSATATDSRTLSFTLRSPVANFGQGIVTSSLTWIASPAALRAGQQSFDAAPVGAGPFVLQSWSRQDEIVLVRNPLYYDAPKPYLDEVTFRTNPDENQRLQTLTSGGADLMISINPQFAGQAESAGRSVTRQQLGGGSSLFLNLKTAPFDDPRARAALIRAVDLDAVNTAIYNGKGTVPRTFFGEGSPFHSGTPLPGFDRAAAQALLDELAAAGKPLSFTMTSYPTPESRALVQAVQAQLSTYRNVTAAIEVLDFTGAAAAYAQRKFQAIISGLVFVDPEMAVWQAMRSGSAGNYMGLADPQLDAALDAGRAESAPAARKAAYLAAEQRIAALDAVLFWTRTRPAIVTNGGVHGVRLYGIGSLVMDGLWRDR